MKRRSKIGGKPAKVRRRSALKPKARSAPKAMRRSGSAPAGQDTEVARLTRELDEAREQQTATGDVLKVISRSSFDLQAVLDTLVKLAARLCEAELVAIHHYRDGVIQFGARFGLPQEWEEITKRNPIAPGRGTVTGRVLLNGKTVQISDVKADPEYTFTEGQKAGGFRTVLGVPLEREGKIIGVIVLARTKRTTDLTEALEQQTATAEVLQVISRSPGALEPVFTTMLENAVRICDAKFGNIYRWDGEALHLLASHNTPTALAEARKLSPLRPHPGTPVDLMVAHKTAFHADIAASQGYIDRSDQGAVAAVELGGVRTILAVPMLQGNNLIGSFSLYRQEVRPFTDKLVTLVTNFAAQAVIAIENARLLNELRQRTSDLTEALEQQTATSEVLQVISSSPGELEPVFTSMLASATRICEAKFGNLLLREGETFRWVAWYGEQSYVPRAEARIIKTDVADIPLSRIAATKQRVHVADLRQEGAYKAGFAPLVALVDEGGARTLLIVPMLREHVLIGAIAIYRQEVRPFTEKQIALVENFAAQAVIAIENARLLTELRESLEEQTATSEVLQVISSSPGDLEPVFVAMLAKAVRICDAKYGTLYLCEDGRLRLVAAHDVPEYFAARRGAAFDPAPGGGLDAVMSTKRAVQIPDLASTKSYIDRHPGMVEAVELAGIRTGLAVPMLKDDDLIGIVAIHRREVLPFTEKQIDLVKNFAAQAVIAIENARLLKELRETTDELVKLNQQLEQRVADQVGEIERMGRLRRFLPPQVADLIVASGTEKQLESHRREITALFCDLRGFTGFSEASAPEDVMTLLRDYHAAIGEIIIKYSGTLERYAGDGVMVVFNDPVPVDNPALRAVQMALETRDAMGALTEKWRELGHDVGFGIGIAHGYATLGTIGFEGRFDYAAIGTVSNVASRLCDEAKPGQILISPRVFMAVKDAVMVEPVGEFTLKGIGRPLAAYNVLAAASPNA